MPVGQGVCVHGLTLGNGIGPEGADEAGAAGGMIRATRAAAIVATNETRTAAMNRTNSLRVMGSHTPDRDTFVGPGQAGVLGGESGPPEDAFIDRRGDR